MTRMPTPPAAPTSVPQPGSDIYTLIAGVGAFSLLIALVFIGVRTYQLFGGLWPPSGG
jgi:hypothetical protein